ncbi:MAG: lysostaphin resistance A-like protein [Planctomycetaceae bacterium]
MGNIFQVMLAVQAAPEIEMTPAKTVAGLLLFLTIAASFGTGVSWLLRLYHGQHPLPLARRLPLQTPPMALLCTAVLTLPMAILALTVSIEQLTADPDAAADTAAADAADADTSAADASAETAPAETAPVNAEPPADAADATGDAAAADLPPSPAELQRRQVQMVLQGILFNAVLVLALGLVVWRQTRRKQQQQAADTALAEYSDVPAGVHELSGWGDLDFAVVAAAPAAVSEPAAEPLHVLTEIRCALQVFLAVVLPSMLLRFLLVLVLTQLTGAVPDRNPLLEILDSETGPLLLLLIVFTAVVVAPIAEELQFRVVLLGGLQQLGLPRRGILLSSTMFTLAHGFPDCIALIPLTAGLCYTWQRRGSYLTCVLVHFLFNLFNILLAVLVLF